MQAALERPDKTQADVWMDIILCSVSQILSLWRSFVVMCVETHLRLVDGNVYNKESWSQILNQYNCEFP